MTAGAGADRLGLENGDAFGSIETLQIRGRRKTAKAAANHRDVDLSRQRCFFGDEVDRPGRLAPTGRDRIRSQRWTRSFGAFSNDACSRSRGTAKSSLSAESIRWNKLVLLRPFDAVTETFGLLDRDFSLYWTRPIHEAIRPLPGSTPDLFTSRARRLEWINDTCVFTRSIQPQRRREAFKWLCDQHR